MQATKRFFAMNALAMLGSFVVTFLAVAVFAAIFMKAGGTDAGLNEMERMFEVRASMSELRREAEALSFEQLLDERYRQRLLERAEWIGASVVVVKNRTVMYASEAMSAIDAESALTLSGGADRSDTLELGGKPYVFARADYHLSSGEDGALLLLAPMELRTDMYLLLGIAAVVVFFLTFLLLNLWVSYRFSRSVIVPVSRLREAAARISEGDLSVGIPEEGEGEVRELCRTLELMRIKLKESIHLQQKYDENRSFLVSSISHDLKTPVTSIRGYIEGILDGVARTPEKVEQYLKTARSKAILVNAMIDDLLLYSKLDLNQLPYHTERTDLKLYFEDCVLDHRAEFEQAGIALRLQILLDGPVFVSIDRERMKRVVQNILDNAKKYMGKQDDGEAVIVLRGTPSSAIVEIRDNGQGIPEGDEPYIFEKFYRGDPSRRSADGSGLGLAIAKQIVEGHGGKIWARSKVGEGTRVMISLNTLR